MGPRGLAVPLVFVLFGATTQPLEAEADTDPRQPASQEEDNEQAEAEEPAPAEGDTETTEFEELVVVTASRSKQALINAPAAVTVVTGETLAATPHQNFADILRRVPGLNATQLSNRDVNIVTRLPAGTISSSQLVLLDGRPLNNEFQGNVFWDQVPIDTGEISQIEVIRGPASAVWGSGAVTGVVNIRTKSPREMVGTTVTLDAGVFDRDVPGNDLDSGNMGAVSVTHAAAVNDRWAYKISGGYLASDPYARPTGQGTDGEAFLNTTSQPKLDARVDYDFPDQKGRLEFAAGIAAQSGNLAVDVGIANIFPGSTQSYARASYLRDAMNLTFFVNKTDAQSQDLVSGIRFDPIDSERYSVDFNDTRLIGKRHVLTYGGNLRYSTFDVAFLPDADNRRNIGVFLQDEIFLTDRLRWVIGGRGDFFKFENRGLLGQDEFSDNVFSPRTVLLFKPNENHTIRLSYTRAFRAPDEVARSSFIPLPDLEIDLEALDPAFAGETIDVPFTLTSDSALEGLESTSYEIGWNAVVSERFLVGAAYYVMELENISTFTTILYSSADPPPGWPPSLLPLLDDLGLPKELRNVNVPGKLDTQGVELSVEARIDRHYSAFANYSWQEEIDSSDIEGFDPNDLTQPPSNRVNVGFNADYGRYFGNLAWNYTDEAFWVAFVSGPTDSFTSLNATVGIRWPDQGVTLMLGGTNLTNDTIQHHIIGDVFRRQFTARLRLTF